MAAKKHMANRILDHLKTQQDQMLEVLKTMVGIESPSRNTAALHKMVSFLQNKFENLGFCTYHLDGNKTGGVLYARPKIRDKNKPIQLLIGHCDTVWALNTLKTMPIKQNENKLSGPGVYDMKAGLTQILFSLCTIKVLDMNLSVTPVILINTDEEIGSHESTTFIKRLSKIANRAFILEPPLGLQGKLKTARKGIGRFVITVKGRSAHAGLDPEKGVNAIVELSHQIQQLYAMNDFKKGITINVGMVEGGHSANVVAANSKAIIDVRVHNSEDGSYITKKIKSLQPMLKDVVLKIEGGIGRPPMEKTTQNKELWQKAKAAGQLLDINLKQATAGGGSDGNTTSLFTATLDGLGTTGDGAHAEHEFIFIDKLIERTALLTLLLINEG